MKLIQIPTCLAIILAPYWILYNKTPLKHNFNNGGLALRSFGYYVLSNCVRVLAIASGVPELLGNYVLSEDIVMALLNSALYLGLLLPLKGKTNANANTGNIVLGIGLGWSLPENLAQTIFEAVKAVLQVDHSDRFYYAALRSNFHVLASIEFAALLFMWQRKQQNRVAHAVMIAVAIVVGPVMSTLNTLKDGDVTLRDFAFLGIQTAMALVLGFAVKVVFSRMDKSQKAA